MAVSTFKFILLCSLLGLVYCNLLPRAQKPTVQLDDVRKELIRPVKIGANTRTRRQTGNNVLNAGNNYGFVDNESSQPGSGVNARVPNGQRPTGNNQTPTGNARPGGNTNNQRPTGNDALTNILGAATNIGSNLNPLATKPTGNNRPTGTGNRPSGLGGVVAGLNPFASRPTGGANQQTRPSATGQGNNNPYGITGQGNSNPYGLTAQDSNNPYGSTGQASQSDDTGDIQFPTRTESVNYSWQDYYNYHHSPHSYNHNYDH